MKRTFFVFLGCFFFFLLSNNNALAGFGISPPYVKNTHLIPGSTYEQEIVLLRSSAETDMEAQVDVDAPEITSWITIDKGTRFVLPKDNLRVPMKVRVVVPPKAEVGSYNGFINIKIASLGDQAAGVSVALGARVDINLTISNETVSDFIIRNITVSNFEELDWPWDSWLLGRFFYKIRAIMTIENTGNSKVAPTKILLDLYDITDKELLESTVDNSFIAVNPFSTAEVEAAFPTKQRAGEYWAHLKAYKDNTVVGNYKYAFRIAKKGELGGSNLGIWPWVLAGCALAAAVILVFIIIKFRAWRILLLFATLIMTFFRPVIIGVKGGFKEVKASFFKWILKKARDYEKRK
jgi:hypothetical protein